MMNPLAGVPAPGVYVDPFLRRQKIEDMPPEEFLSIPIGDLTQTGELIAGANDFSTDSLFVLLNHAWH